MDSDNYFRDQALIRKGGVLQVTMNEPVIVSGCTSQRKK